MDQDRDFGKTVDQAGEKEAQDMEYEEALKVVNAHEAQKRAAARQECEAIYRSAVDRAAAALRRGPAGRWELAQLAHDYTDAFKCYDFESLVFYVSVEEFAVDVAKKANMDFDGKTARELWVIWDHLEPVAEELGIHFGIPIRSSVPPQGGPDG